MKRKYKSYKVKKIWPIFFWYYCDWREREFKKEFGWKVISTNFPDTYICCDCCPTQEELEKHIDVLGIVMRPRPASNK